ASSSPASWKHCSHFGASISAPSPSSSQSPHKVGTGPSGLPSTALMCMTDGVLLERASGGLVLGGEGGDRFGHAGGEPDGEQGEGGKDQQLFDGLAGFEPQWFGWAEFVPGFAGDRYRPQ